MNAGAPVTTAAAVGHRAAAALEARLGDPRDPRSELGFEAACRRDERAIFPHELAAAARAEDLHLSYLPRRLGGTLAGWDRTLMQARVAARRDLCVMPATMVSISAVTSLLAARDESAAERAAQLIRGGGTVSYALSEKAAGSDPLAVRCALTAVGDGYELDGNKWLVAMADRSQGVFVLAHSGGRGPAAFTALLLERDKLPSARMRTRRWGGVDGMRGIDFGSCEFQRCPVGADAIVGAPGEGLEAAMKAQQVVKLISAAGCLAAADTALRVTLDFASAATLSGRPLLDQPTAGSALSRAFAALAAADVTALVSARSLQLAPERASIAAAVTKRLATQLANESIAAAGSVLGGRGLLTEGPTGIVQKMRRDCAVVEYFDTSPIPNLRGIAMQIPMLAKRAAAGTLEPGPELHTTLDLGARTPEMDPADLRLHASGRDDIIAGVLECGDEIVAALDDDPAAVLAGAAIAQVRTALAGAPGVDGAVATADRFCRLYGAACCLLLWHANRHGDALFAQPPGSTSWLAATLSVLLDGGGPLAPVPDAGAARSTLLELYRDDRLFSAVALELARSTPPTEVSR